MKQVEIKINIYDYDKISSKEGKTIFACTGSSRIFIEKFKTNNEIWGFLNKNHSKIIKSLKQEYKRDITI